METIRNLIQDKIQPEAALFPLHEEGVPSFISVRADYFEGQIDLKRFRAMYPHYPVLLADPLIIELQRWNYAVITKFGAVVFWGCTDQTIHTLLSELNRLPGALNRDEEVQDTLIVKTGQKQDCVTFNEVWLSDLTLDKLKIISVALGQSVALERFEIEVSRALKRYEPVVAQLRARGRLVLSQKEILRMVGFAMEVRSVVLANLTLFDDPPETWESEALAHLDSQLYDNFDLAERVAAINQKVAYLTDVDATMMDLLNTRKSHRLEWIIIVLIFLEFLFFIFSEIGH